MLLIAGAPPLPFGGKLFVTLLMLTVVGVVMRLVGRGPLRGRSIVLAVATALAIVTTLELVLSGFDTPRLNDRGILGGVIGALSAAYFLRGGNRELSSRRLGLLSGIALATGPLMGLLLGLLIASRLIRRIEPGCFGLASR